MYKFERYRQLGLADLNRPVGLKMNLENRWVKKAATIPWEAIEEKYAVFFPSKTGIPAKPPRMALGSLMIQKQYGYSDRELLEQITENSYYQYFVGLPGFQNEPLYVPSLLIEFRRRLNDEIMTEISGMITTFNSSDDPGSGKGGGNDPGDVTSGQPENSGTIILDATCAPQNISYPQDVNLLNEVRENLEGIIDELCYEYGYCRPRTYRKNARRDYLNLAKCKKLTAKKIRKAIKRRQRYEVLRQVYEQQRYMYENEVYTVPDRIVSISQPYVRPIVCGKAGALVEFGAKLDISIDERGMARLEKLSFDAYNESDVLVGAIERYRKRTGHYPERALADKIYRNRENLAFCRLHGIRLSGSSLGRPKKNALIDEKSEYVDDADRIEVERSFSLAKRCYGLGRIMTKLDVTTRSSIALSILVMNVSRIAARFLRHFLMAVFSRYLRRYFMPFYDQNVVNELLTT